MNNSVNILDVLKESKHIVNAAYQFIVSTTVHEESEEYLKILVERIDKAIEQYKQS